MNPEERSSKFTQTQWTLVLSAREPDSIAAADALEELCRVYWYPLYSYLRRRGQSPEEAQDLTQAFFARLIEKRKLAGLKREGGKFRSFLLKSLDRFLVDEWHKGEAEKRGAHRIVSLDAAAAESRYRLEPADSLTPDKVMAKNWALTLLDTVYRRLQREFLDAGKGTQFDALAFALTGDRSDVSYAGLAEKLELSEGAVKVAVHRLRQRYREVLRDEVAQTVESPEEVEGELRELMRAVAG